MEIPLRGADGVFRWFLTRVRPVRHPNGLIVRWVGTCANVDARKRAEEARDQALAALQESEERYSALFENSPFPLALTSMPEGVTEAANQAFLDPDVDDLTRSVAELVAH